MNSFWINCNNHGCTLRDACGNYMNKSGEEKYCRPMITYDSEMFPKMICDFLLPHNMDTLKQKYERDSRRHSHKLRLAYKIVDELGNVVNKEKLMKDLNVLIK